MNSNRSIPSLTAADLLIRAVREAGVSVIFANFGSDHPDLIEALAKERLAGERLPAIVLCPHESNALSAAHGYALATGEPQAVFVHTDVGTANLGGSVHNAARSHVPVLIFAGLTPFTLEGELPGTRNTHINYIQDAHNQHDLVRPFVKWSYDIRTARNITQVVFRAMQLSNSAPRGPVYLTGAREVLAETVDDYEVDYRAWSPIAPIPAGAALVQQLVREFDGAQFPLIVTSFLGRNPQAVDKLVRVAERLGVAVVETVPSQMNFPADHPLHLGYTVDDLIDRADVILAIDSDVPWVLSRKTPAADALVYLVDDDPLKESQPLWYLPSEHFVRANSETFLDQLLEALPEQRPSATERTARFAELHSTQRSEWARHLEAAQAQESLTAEVVCAAISEIIDEETIILNETITNADTVSRYIPRTRAGTVYGNAGGSLGWSGGAAVGVKLARPDTTVVSLVGDGTYYLSVPSATYWMAEQYSAPFLTVILDNGGWNATKQNLIKQYPGGAADQSDQYWVNLSQSADLPGIASAAGGAFAATVSAVADLKPALVEGMHRVTSGQSAVVSVKLRPVSFQEHDVVGPHE